MTTTNPARDWELTCDHCDGSGHVYVKHQVAERQSDVQEFKEECDCCEGRGFVFAFQDIPGIEEYVKTCRPAPAALGVSTVEQDERSATHGMTLGERIAHVGGRTNAQGYIEFGSPMAVDALIQHVLRDIDCTRQEDDGAYQARYRLPGGQWSSWGHVVCGVKGHEQELRYLPGERRPAPAAGDALDVDALSNAIRSIDGKHTMGAGELAEALMPLIQKASTAALNGDTGRLDFLVAHRAWVGWSKDREYCAVYRRDDEGYTEPMTGWTPTYLTPREAIDAAHAAFAARRKGDA